MQYLLNLLSHLEISSKAKKTPIKTALKFFKLIFLTISFCDKHFKLNLKYYFGLFF